jgi:hypothetical protein
MTISTQNIRVDCPLCYCLQAYYLVAARTARVARACSIAARIGLFCLLPVFTADVYGQETRLHAFGGFFALPGESRSPLPGPPAAPQIQGNFVSIQGTGTIFGLALGRRVAEPLSAEATVSFSPAGSMIPFGFGTVATPTSYSTVSGGSTILLDGGIMWNLPHIGLINPFVSGRAGLAVRTAALSGEALTTLSACGRLQGETLWVGPVGRQTNGFLRLGFGLETGSGRWRLRIETRDRIEPNVLPGGSRHFLEVTAGPTIVF